jgi:Pentapeptide repeats (8 copies)
VVSGCLVCAVGAALFWKKIRVALKPVPDDLGWFWGALIAAGIFLLVALFVYFVAKRTLWELAALLIVPLALVGVGLWFTMQQDARQQAIENQRVQAAALQAYLDQMSQLLLEENLLNAEDGDEVLTLARARTLTTLEGLDSPRHKGAVIRFLSEAGLINDSVVTIPEGGVPPISLSGVNLQEADLTVNIALNKAFLEGANLRDANLSGTSLAKQLV